MEMVKQCIAENIDIFCAGIWFGVIGVLVGQYITKLCDLWIGNNQKKMDIELRKVIVRLQEQIEGIERIRK